MGRKNRFDVKTRSELINEAVKHHVEHRSPFDVIMTKYNLSFQDATNAIIEGRKIIKETELIQKKHEYNWEDEIKGLDWQYNPEREIKNYQIPKY